MRTDPRQVNKWLAPHGSSAFSLLWEPVPRQTCWAEEKSRRRGRRLFVIQASSSAACSMAAGIFATDIRVRATWFSS